MTWKERLEIAQKKKCFTDEDKTLSRLWITDPISELTNKIPLIENDLKKGPNDIYLILDGIFFTEGVLKDDFNLAFNCYTSINKRALDLGDKKCQK
jgi:hypothetical protein